MKRLSCLILLLLLNVLTSTAARTPEEPLLKELDIVLSEGGIYMEQKENRISRLKDQLNREVSPEKQFELCNSIISEYRSYISDSALTYIDKNIRLAALHNNIYWETQSKLQYSFVLSFSGLFVESIKVINSIDTSTLTDNLKIEYFKCKEVLYNNQRIYLEGETFVGPYDEIIANSRDSALFYLPESSSERLFYKFLIARDAGEFNEALTFLQAYLDTLVPGTHEHAKKSYSLYNLYKQLGREEESIPYLIYAVISDVQDAVKENRALLDLALWLYEQKDIDRAYRYIQYALKDANFYGARFRYYEISQSLPVITNAFQQQNIEQNDRLKGALLFSILLFIILLVTIFYLSKQMKALHSARIVLDKTNKDLEGVNNKLNKLNNELYDANLIKEEYIGYFMDLCSEYINKLEDYRKSINNKIATKRFDELSKMTNSAGKNHEVKELYRNFDKAFLNIYPGFVNSFNNLLKPEERFEIRKGELNTELRVFALIRLGITDSAKIASFLRSSIQTVYNYRSKIKKKSISENDDIEEKIKRIDVLSPKE